MRVLDKATMQRVEEYNIEYQRKNGLSPSFRQIMNALSFGSLATVQRYIKALEREGRITRTNIGTIQPMPQLKSNGVTIAPLVGAIACGQPNFAVEDIEGSYAFPKEIFGNGQLFMLHASGDSMIEAGIDDGDLLVLRKTNTADDGEIVVALIDGNATLKRLFHKGRKIILRPENSTMKDIIVPRCEVQGVLVSCIKMFNR